jgi:hypothetical protein
MSIYRSSLNDPSVAASRVPRSSRLPAGRPDALRPIARLDEWSVRFAVEGSPVQAYSEQAFRYLLDVERKRSERSGRSFLLLLIDVKTRTVANPLGDVTIAGALFRALSTAVRETDFVGWHRTGRVAAAVLTQHADDTGPDISGLATHRITRVLHEALPADIAARIRCVSFRLPNELAQGE